MSLKIKYKYILVAKYVYIPFCLIKKIENIKRYGILIKYISNVKY